MVSGKRTLKRLDITSQEVENVAIPGIQQVHMFYPSLDGNTLYFVGQAEGKTIWNVYRYALDTQELTQLTFPKQPTPGSLTYRSRTSPAGLIFHVDVASSKTKA